MMKVIRQPGTESYYAVDDDTTSTLFEVDLHGTKDPIVIHSVMNDTGELNGMDMGFIQARMDVLKAYLEKLKSEV